MAGSWQQKLDPRVPVERPHGDQHDDIDREGGEGVLLYGTASFGGALVDRI